MFILFLVKFNHRVSILFYDLRYRNYCQHIHLTCTSLPTEVIEIANIEKQKFSQKANSPEGASNPRYTNMYEALIHHTTSYINKLEGFRNKELDRESAKNIHEYTNFVKLKYSKYIQGNQFVKTAYRRKIMSHYSANFNMLLDGIMNLYPCLYKMNETTRYPLRDFGYANLCYLNKKTHVITF